MVTAAATFGRSGSHDFILLRASAIVIVLYTLFMAGFFLSTPDVTYQVWTGLFANTWMKVSTMLVLSAVLIHGWIGIWQVTTDYVKASGIRAFIQLVVSVGLIAAWLTGLFVLWGV